MRLRVALLFALLSLLVNACSDDSSDNGNAPAAQDAGQSEPGLSSGDQVPNDQPPGEQAPGDQASGDDGESELELVRRFGQIFIQDRFEDPANPQVTDDYIGAFFFSLVEPMSRAELEQSVMVEEDACAINDVTLEELEEIDLSEVFAETLDAGETLSISSPAGSFVTLFRINDGGFLIYEAENDQLPGPLPAELEISVSGADFPAFQEVPATVVEPLIVTNISTDDGGVIPELIEWQSNGNPSTYISIGLFLANVEQGAAVEIISLLNCLLEDDGSFTLPADILAMIPPDSTRIFAQISRVGITSRMSNDALFIVNRTFSTIAVARESAASLSDNAVAKQLRAQQLQSLSNLR